MFAIDFDSTAKLREVAPSRAEELMHTETNRGARGVELVALLRRNGGAETRDYERCCDKTAGFHFRAFFASVASVFKSGVRESGNRPNKFPNANAGSAFKRV